MYYKYYIENTNYVVVLHAIVVSRNGNKKWNKKQKAKGKKQKAKGKKQKQKAKSKK